jgi:hypothetical protein
MLFSLILRLSKDEQRVFQQTAKLFTSVIFVKVRVSHPVIVLCSIRHFE